MTDVDETQPLWMGLGSLEHIHQEEDVEFTLARTRTFFRSSQAIGAAVFASGVIIGLFVVDTWLSLAFLAAIALNIAAMEWCARALRMDNIVKVTLAATFTNWGLSIVLAPMVSFALPVLMLPILITLLSMAPMLDRYQVRRFIIAAAVVITLVATLALTIEGPIDEQIPDNLGHIVVIVSLALFTVPMGFLAWDTHVRHAVAMERMASINLALRSSRRRLVEVADEERRQLERNLHDGAQQQLVGVAMRLRVLGAQHPDAADDVTGLVGDLQEAMDELRELAHGLYPPLLEARGLVEAIPAAARRSTLHTNVEIEDIGRYSQQVETAFYFCCLEALQNAAKHAGDDTTVTISAGDDGGTLTMTISDDGPGFDTAQQPDGRGLRNMIDRLAAVDGDMTVESTPGVGTVVTARVDGGAGTTTNMPPGAIEA